MNENPQGTPGAAASVPSPVPTPIPTEGPTIAPTLAAPEAPKATTAESPVKVHDAARIGDTAYWSTHAIAGTVVLLSIIAIFVAKGPTRRQAVEALAQQQKKSS